MERSQVKELMMDYIYQELDDAQAATRVRELSALVEARGEATGTAA